MKSLDKSVLEIVETKQPKNVKEMVQLVQEQVGPSLGDIASGVREL